MKVSVIVPVYNSSLMLRELCERIFKIMKKLGLTDDFELIMINDSSHDDSWNKICELAKTYNFILGLNLNGNFGQHNAIMSGLNNCKGKYIITLDDDLQHPPEFFPDILEALKYSQVCYTNYRNRKHIGWKKFVSKLNNLVSSFILNKPPKIYMSSFRGFTKEVNLKIIEFKKPDVYLDGLILNTTRKIKMISVDHHARKIGQSNYDIKKLFILWSNMILNFSFLPLRPASIVGISLKIAIKIFRKKNLKPQYVIKERTDGKA